MELNELHYKEYDKLQKEILQLLGEIGSLEKFSVVSSGTIFSWLLVNADKIPNKIGFFFPAIIVLLFGLITFGLFKRIKLIGEYIKEKYEKFLNEGQNQKYGFGWENYLDNSLGKQPSLLFSGRFGMWVIHLLIDVGIAIILTI
ncbi:MAG: hypothetical protein KBF82_10985 [Chitinophagaceae bacterium]|nr:hypothetical protein [Chitinophagaceae bacterium]